MNTRMKLWQNYRNEIRKNIALKEAMISSDKQIKHLHNKIKRVYPQYDDMYGVKRRIGEFTVIDVASYEKIDTAELDKIIEYINSIDSNNDVNTKAIEEISFSSGDMEEIGDALKRINHRRHLDLDDNVVIKTKFIKLGDAMIMKKIRIAIDGPSGSGKTTVARELAKRLGYKYISTGLVYRAIALNVLEKSIPLNDRDQIISSLEDGMIKLLDNEIVFLHNEDVTSEVRSDEVSQASSKVSTIPEVRNWAQKIQIEYGQRPGTIMDGRDTTFNIMPDAELKIFMDTSPEVRAKRRLSQNKELGFSTDYHKILKEIQERDYRDRNREIDPLHATEDAKIIDATNLSINECVEMIMDYASIAIKNIKTK